MVQGAGPGRKGRPTLSGRGISPSSGPEPGDLPHPRRNGLGSGAQAAGSGFDGDLDEIRVTAGTRSATWVRAQYESMHGDLASVGTVETP